MTKKVILIVVSMRKRSTTLKWRKTEIAIKENPIGQTINREMIGTSIADLNMKNWMKKKKMMQTICCSSIKIIKETMNMKKRKRKKKAGLLMNKLKKWQPSKQQIS